MSKILTAYFSASGITAKAAKEIARITNSDLFEIRPQIPYTKADLNWTDEKSRSTSEMQNPASRPEIADKVTDMETYDIVFIGFPIWWYVAPTIINTFLESYDFSGKTIIPFATSGGSEMGKTNEKLAVSCPKATLLDGKAVNRMTKQELKDWINQMI